MAYTKEDVGSLLKNFEQFQEGGARIALESGRYCAQNEIAIRVKLHKEDDIKQFYFSTEYTVQQCKSEICEAFNINADDANSYTLFRLDTFD